jgi:N-acetylglucosaminyldiphosphoundecaprenol N-acetyl-beta-D-mannosaminyltransferase
MRDTVSISGIPIDKLDTEKALERIEEFIANRRFHQVATANTNFLVNALFDLELRHILRASDLVVPDGMLVVWAAKLLGAPLIERVTGADLVPRLAEISARKGYKIFMLGAKPEIAQKAKACLLERFPGVQIVGCYSPPNATLVQMDSEEILRQIEEARPDILLVAFGNPKQEKWIHLYQERLAAIPVPVCIGVGGTFDFISGTVPRAPQWMQKCGIEFFWRFLHDPVRLGKRYAHDFRHFVPHLMQQRIALRGKPEAEGTLIIEPNSHHTVFRVKGVFGHRILEKFEVEADAAIDAGSHLVIDLSGVSSFDAYAIGKIINLPKRASYRKRRVYLISPVNGANRILEQSRLNGGLFHTVRCVEDALSDEGRSDAWQLRVRADGAVVTLHGTLERSDIARLGVICGNTLQKGKRVFIDARDLTYVDSYLLVTLYHTAYPAGEERSPYADRFRIVPGELLQKALLREKLTDAFTLIPASELDTPATNACEFDDQHPISDGKDSGMETPVNTVALFAPRSG